MSKVIPGRYAATIEVPFVIFIIGMPVYGLASAAEHVPATGRKEIARRMGGESEPAVPTPA